METNTIKEFKIKFQVEELEIFSNDAWVWSVRPDQPTIGSGVLSLKRHAMKLSDVTQDEIIQLGTIVKIIEGTLQETFSYEIMNYLMLMMVDHHVHYHVIPRYPQLVEFAGESWEDSGWPTLPSLGDSQHKDSSTILIKLKDFLRSQVAKNG